MPGLAEWLARRLTSLHHDACATCALVRILVSPENNCQTDLRNVVKLELISLDMQYNNNFAN